MKFSSLLLAHAQEVLASVWLSWQQRSVTHGCHRSNLSRADTNALGDRDHIIRLKTFRRSPSVCWRMRMMLDKSCECWIQQRQQSILKLNLRYRSFKYWINIWCGDTRMKYLRINCNRKLASNVKMGTSSEEDTVQGEDWNRSESQTITRTRRDV